mmetsp:Transcript_75064/g.172051  ORF Transcript_75064/g.172051 Transcript_75064/m.172051 type:complete len:230 (-) Transcript_75064:4-693(-)
MVTCLWASRSKMRRARTTAKQGFGRQNLVGQSVKELYTISPLRRLEQVQFFAPPNSVHVRVRLARENDPGSSEIPGQADFLNVFFKLLWLDHKDRHSCGLSHLPDHEAIPKNSIHIFAYSKALAVVLKRPPVPELRHVHPGEMPLGLDPPGQYVICSCHAPPGCHPFTHGQHLELQVVWPNWSKDQLRFARVANTRSHLPPCPIRIACGDIKTADRNLLSDRALQIVRR